MSKTVIHVENLSKRYRMGKSQDLRDTLAKLLAAPWRSVRGLVQRQASNSKLGHPDEFLWALRDVAFDVKQGEIVGVIGRNGAGKSTLLKILSRITKPTSGFVKLRGRVGSLLEVGTGFHPELTGKENIYLNAAILGMKKAEIEAKFDEIVDFADMDRFMSTPVKHYSSGMQMRLAFAVAAYLQPEILLIDEVLAVGDAAFQKKSLGKMKTVAKDGRTVLFVSHNLVAVQDLCQRVLWIDNGQIRAEGDPATIIGQYLQNSYSTLTERVWHDAAEAPGDDQARLHRICVRPVNGSPSDQITVRTPIVIEFDYWNGDSRVYLKPAFKLFNEQGVLICSVAPVYLSDWREHIFPVGLIRAQCLIPGDLLNDGLHRVAMLLEKNDEILVQDEDALTFDVRDSVEKRDGWYGKWAGAIRPIFEWDMEVRSSGPGGLAINEELNSAAR